MAALFGLGFAGIYHLLNFSNFNPAREPSWRGSFVWGWLQKPAGCPASGED